MSPGINAASFAAVLSHTDAGLPRWRKCPAESSNLFTSVNPVLPVKMSRPSGMGTDTRQDQMVPGCMCSDLRDDKATRPFLPDQSQHRLFAGYTLVVRHPICRCADGTDGSESLICKRPPGFKPEMLPEALWKVSWFKDVEQTILCHNINGSIRNR